MVWWLLTIVLETNIWPRPESIVWPALSAAYALPGIRCSRGLAIDALAEGAFYEETFRPAREQCVGRQCQL